MAEGEGEGEREQILNLSDVNQVVLAQWLAGRLATCEVRSSNTGKGDNLINF